MADDFIGSDTDSRELSEDSRYQGVSGLLLCFCIMLTVLVPFQSANILVTHFRMASDSFDYVDGLKTYLFITTGLRLFLVILSMHAGMALWSVSPNAVRTVKRYLFTFLGVLLLGIGLAFILVDWPPDSAEILVSEVLKEGVPSLTFFAACYLYITKSKRVKATYLG